MSRPAIWLTMLALVAADVLVYGRLTGRWTPSHELEEAVARLKRVPLDLGDWQGEALELPPRHVERAEIAGYLYRRYQNRRTGATVSLLLVCGRSGPIAVHTPDVCYAGNGYNQAAPEARTEVPLGADATARCWTARFGKVGPLTTSHLLIDWMWNAGGGWEAPANPRWAFAGRPVLYKLYVVRETASADDAAEDKLCHDFLREVLPPINDTLFTPLSSPETRIAAR